MTDARSPLPLPLREAAAVVEREGGAPPGVPPVLVAGMHRSGTSLVASLLEAAGLWLGDHQLPADQHNPRGYVEDVEFLTLQREMLAAATRPGDGGHRDWGWTESGQLDVGAFEGFGGRARALVASRAAAARPWGWKDPRTTLLLDFWRRVAPAARYVLVYRFPWEVADSMQRLGAEVFLRRPDYAYRIWAFYNRHLLDFFTRHRETSLLVCCNALRSQPERFFRLVEQRLGLCMPSLALAETIDPALLRSHPVEDPLVDLVAAAHPRCRELLEALDAVADLPGAGRWHARPPRPPVDRGSRLSVVIPCCDHGELLLEAVASAQRSIPEPFELVVVDDGSVEPRTLEVMSLLGGAGYRVVTQPHAGLATARNHGMDLARGPYLLPLDADNRLRPGFVDAAVALLDARPEVGVVYPEREEFGLRSGRVGVPRFDLPALLVANYVDACTVLRKQVWSEAGGFDAGMPMPGWEDWDLWLGACERGWQLQHLPEAVIEYRVRPASMIAVFDDAEHRASTLRYLLGKHHRLYSEHLADVLLCAQGLTGELWRAARALERSDGERRRLQAAWEDAQQDRIGLRAERTGVVAELERLRAELVAAAMREKGLRRQLQNAQKGCRRLREEREALCDELAALSDGASPTDQATRGRLQRLVQRLGGRGRRVPQT